MDEAPGFSVDQPGFRGSLGELAHALRSHALPPSELDLYQLVRSYLAHFDEVAERDLELATEALPRVAQVIELKVRLLLPRPPRQEPEEEGEALDDALAAVALLEELEEAIDFLRRRRDERRLVLPARAPRPEYPRPERPVRAAAGDLARLAGRYRLGSYFELAVERLTLAGAMRRVMAALRKWTRGRLFALAGAEDWPSQTVAFAALLELVKQDRVRARQEAAYGPIELERGARVDDPDDGSESGDRPAEGSRRWAAGAAEGVAAAALRGDGAEG